jgi:hypothetical protein
MKILVMQSFIPENCPPRMRGEYKVVLEKHFFLFKSVTE